jgi:predicted KAP-like P-loop ATPase
LDSDQEADIATTYWRLKTQAAERPKTVVVRFSPWLISGRTEMSSALLSELARSLGPELGPDVRRAFANLLRRLSELSQLAGAGIDVATGGYGGTLLSSAMNYSSDLATRQTEGPTLDELRKRLASQLSRLRDQQVLVVVDDLDRLTPAETLEMISLVKRLGDLPNTVYLLTYDEPRIIDALSRANVDGHAYLEKIVQYAIWLPLPDDDAILRVVNADLERIFGVVDEEESELLGRAWYYVLRHYLRNVRDVRRFANAVAFSWASVRDHVNLFDLVILETLRVFEPIIYAELRGDFSSFVED